MQDIAPSLNAFDAKQKVSVYLHSIGDDEQTLRGKLETLWSECFPSRTAEFQVFAATLPFNQWNDAIVIKRNPVLILANVVSHAVNVLNTAILFTHSQGGGPGWYTAMKNDKVKAIVTFEPGSSFVFPEKVPEREKSAVARHFLLDKHHMP